MRGKVEGGGRPAGSRIPPALRPKKNSVFLSSCNMTCLDNVESGALTEFGELQQRVDQGKWITSTSIRVELLTAKIR